jgi:hypothetical protein
MNLESKKTGDRGQDSWITMSYINFFELNSLIPWILSHVPCPEPISKNEIKFYV